jgi:DNA-binding winged helix-turn-helix (wHTH) protein
MTWPHQIEVKGVVVDTRSGDVTGGPAPSRLQPKTLEVFLCLAEQAPQVATKKEIFERVWPQTAVSENVLAQAISDLRRAFGESPGDPVIETVPKVGYRLVAAAGKGTWSKETSPKSAPTLPPPDPARERKPGFRFWQVAFLLILGAYLLRLLIVTLQGRGLHH